MNDEFDPLEAELAALRPKAPSPRLESAVGNVLRDVPDWRVVSNPRTVLLVAATIGAVAASVLAAAWFWRGNEHVVETIPPAPWPTPPLATAFDSGLPSVWAFRSAGEERADRLNDLLDEHAGRPREARSEFVQIRGFGVSETKSLEMLKEL